MLKVQIAAIHEYADPLRFQTALLALPWPEKRERILCYRQEADRRRGLAAWSLAASMLRAAGARDLTLAYSPAGKPFLPGHPGIHFNLSHGGDLAVCGVSDRPLGVDVESLLPADPDMAAYAFSPAERAWLEEQPDPARAFTRLWVRKESYLKCLGTGLSVPLQELNLLPGKAYELNCYFKETETRDHRISVCSMT